MLSHARASAVIGSIQSVVRLALILVIVGSLLLFAAHFVQASWLTESWPIVQLHRFGNPIIAHMAVWLHVPAANTYMPLALAAIVYLVMLISDRLVALARRTVASLSVPPRSNGVKLATAASGVASEKVRSQLYKEYRAIEKTLKEAKRKRCTFLSLDVVGSTSIKSGESEIAATSTFHAYEDLVRRTLRATRAWKQSWTPDGVMICFVNRADAVEAAQTILEGMLTFNERDNALKARFEIRCGLNEGEVVIFEDSAIEKLVERTIDVAGHMQKSAKPGTLWLSKDVHDALGDASGFNPTGQEVDGYPTYEWSPKPKVDPGRV